MELLENCAIFDPQLFLAEENALSGYGTAEIEALAKNFGKKHDGGKVPLCVDPERLKRGWQFVKTVMFDVRRRPTVVRSIKLLAAAKEVADGAGAAGWDDGEEEGSKVDPAAG